MHALVLQEIVAACKRLATLTRERYQHRGPHNTISQSVPRTRRYGGVERVHTLLVRVQ